MSTPLIPSTAVLGPPQAVLPPALRPSGGARLRAPCPPSVPARAATLALTFVRPHEASYQAFYTALPHSPGHYDEVELNHVRVVVDAACAPEARDILATARKAAGVSGEADALQVTRSVWPGEAELQTRGAALGWVACGWAPPSAMKVIDRS